MEGCVVSVGSLLSVGMKQSRCNPCVQLITLSGMLRYLNCRFVALPNFLGFVVCLFLIEASILRRLFYCFLYKLITVMNEMHLY